MEKEKILDSAIDSPVSEEIELKRGKELIKVKIIALEGVYCKTLSTLASKVYQMPSNNLQDLIDTERQLFEVCLRYGYEEFDEKEKKYSTISTEEIKKLIEKDFKFSQTIYGLVQALTISLNTAENEELKDAKKN